MIVTILTLFVIYTVCCCLDAPELKVKRKQLIHDWCEKQLAHYNSPFRAQHVQLYETIYEPVILTSRTIITDYEKFVLGEDKAIERARDASLRKLFSEILVSYKDSCVEESTYEDPVTFDTIIECKVNILTNKSKRTRNNIRK